ncbi:hypothetical protein ES332_A08G094700v1 [Gossypium tomentosum]|uniref:Uncharacterized protein n=1 Tax=Gossypium tomentosum TaxID=34277 RepID=A0A5D2PFB3_GOSTO|nr:hypothetical protein ES332_A08G094700v1 [Gossypium tomentosum]
MGGSSGFFMKRCRFNANTPGIKRRRFEYVCKLKLCPKTFIWLIVLPKQISKPPFFFKLFNPSAFSVDCWVSPARNTPPPPPRL